MYLCIHQRRKIHLRFSKIVLNQFLIHALQLHLKALQTYYHYK